MTLQQENTTSESIENEMTEQELDKIDANLLEIEILFKSRCVQPRGGKNVTVREIEKKG
jgi:hypothetical protein